MSDIVKLLPDSVANQIAAGEVIQRPASVVKELVENSVDAGADEIEIIIVDAGRTLIQVIDNGMGMSPTDARMAFERHATSKISKADDLFSLHTMGFRGEALPSIAAVSRIDLKTRPKDANVGSRIIINGSKVESQEAEICSAGSNMMVKSLFYNVPARRKFLKKDAVELSNILREFERLALVNTNVEFTLVSNDTILHKLRKASLKQRIIDLFGKGLEQQLITIETITQFATIKGFISLPQYAKKRNYLQYFFVNGRNMKHPYFHKAIIKCYENLIPADSQPNYFIDFTVDPQTIDVNIHPTKNEIKFEDEAAIWQILIAAIKESLGSYNGMPGIDFSEDIKQIPFFNPDSSAKYDEKKSDEYNPFKIRREISSQFNKVCPNPLKGSGADWNRLYEEFTAEADKQNISLKNVLDDSILNQQDNLTPVENSLFELEELSSNNSYLLLKGKFIIIPVKEGLMFIDQHRAHIRILYDKYRESFAKNETHSQRIMFPELLTLSPSQNVTLNTILPEIQQIGFDLLSLGGCDWNIIGYPSIIQENNPMEILMKIIEDEAGECNNSIENITDRIALSMAKSASVKTGKNLTDAEVDFLIAQLFSLPSSKYTPDGLPITGVLKMDEIMKLLV